MRRLRPSGRACATAPRPRRPRPAAGGSRGSPSAAAPLRRSAATRAAGSPPQPSQGQGPRPRQAPSGAAIEASGAFRAAGAGHLRDLPQEPGEPVGVPDDPRVPGHRLSESLSPVGGVGAPAEQGRPGRLTVGDIPATRIRLLSIDWSGITYPKHSYNLVAPRSILIIELLHKSESRLALIVCSVSAVFVAPLVEEFLFRVVLQGWFERIAMLRRTASKEVVSPARRHAESNERPDFKRTPAAVQVAQQFILNDDTIFALQ